MKYFPNVTVICEERIFVQSGIECGCNGTIMQLELNRIRCRLNPVPRPLRVSQTNRFLRNQMVMIDGDKAVTQIHHKIIPHDSRNIQSDANGLCPKKIKFQPLRIILGQEKNQAKIFEDSIGFVQGDWNPNAIPRLVSAMCPRFLMPFPRHPRKSSFPKSIFALFLKQVAMRAFWIRRMAPGWHVSTLKAKHHEDHEGRIIQKELEKNGPNFG